MRVRAIGVLCGACLLLGGCLGVGQRQLPKDRVDYAAAIADARKQQALLNIVRIRYSEFPSFIDLTQVVTNYSLLHQLAVKTLIKTPFDGPNDDLSGVYTAQFAERPSLTYLPVGGADFVRKMLTPLDMSVILSLVQTGWQADRLMETLVVSVNGKVNTELQGGVVNRADPEFLHFVEAMHEAQQANALTIDIKPLSAEELAAIAQTAAVSQAVSAVPSSAARGAALAGIPPPPKLKVDICIWEDMLDEGALGRLAEVREELGMDPASECYRVISGDTPRNPGTVAIQTRSLIHLLAELAAGVEVPPSDLASGAAPGLATTEVVGGSGDEPLIHIHSGPNRPDDPLVAIEYGGSWFWIDNTDNQSKRTFAYLSILLSITESGAGGAQLVVTTN